MNPFLEWGCNIVFDNRISYSRFHLHLSLSTPLREIVLVFSPLHDFHVFKDPSASVLNTSLNFNWAITYLDFNCQGSPRGVFAGHFWNWK